MKYKNKQLLVFILVTIMLTLFPISTFAKPLDIYHQLNTEEDTSFISLLFSAKKFFEVATNIDRYFIESRNGKYYSLKETDEEAKKGAEDFNEAAKNLEAFIMVESETTQEKISTTLKNNTASEDKSYYTEESWSAYEKARAALTNLGDKRFIRESIFNQKISDLETAYRALSPAVVDKEELARILDQARLRDGDNYVKAFFDKLQDAISAGQAVYDDEKASQGQVDQAIRYIKKALADLLEASKIVYVINPDEIKISQGGQLDLPTTVKVIFEDEKRESRPVEWEPKNPDTSKPGTLTLTGQVQGTDIKAKINVTISDQMDKSSLEATIAMAKGILKGDLIPADQSKLRQAIAMADKVFNDPNSQDEIDRADQDLKKVLEELEDYPAITNLQPNVAINVQPGQTVEISFDSKSGGQAYYEISMPIRTYMTRSAVDINMKEDPAGSGYYKGVWEVPEGMYGGSFEVNVSLLIDDMRISEKADGIINITNEFTVSYLVANEVIGTEALKAGGYPRSVPKVEKEGYTFSHWELYGKEVDPRTVQIDKNTSFTAVVEAVSDLFVSVSYVDGQGKEIKESKTIDKLTFGTELTEKAPEIEGYQARDNELTLTVGTENKLTFIYDLRTDIAYKVNYKSNGEVIKESEEFFGTFGQVNHVEAPEIPGYNLSTTDSTIILGKLSGNEIDLEYSPREDIPYTVKHIEILADGETRELGSSTGTGTYKSSVEVKAKDYPGLVADESTKTIELKTLEDNTLVFEYREKDGLYYTINYKNRQGETWSKQVPARFGQEVLESDLRSMEIVNNNQDYAIEKIEEKSIKIDDRLENNVFNVEVYKIYPISKHQDLKNLADKADDVTRPAYAKDNPAWQKFWADFETAKNNFKNTDLTEDNLKDLKEALEDQIEIIEMIKDFDSAWKDRPSPKGFEKTINDQAKTPDVYGRFEVYANQYTDTITVGMSKEQQGKTFAGGAVSVGLKTAMLNVLKSKNLYVVESKGIQAVIRTPDGKRVSDADLMDRGIDLAGKWLPPGSNPFKNKWVELIGEPPVDFIMYGKTSKGTEVIRAYTFIFKDKGDM
ncbi:Ig-like domain-containing protein [uncultured Ezakiella sp.]|uniref:Ig-like domain-containing protein n=1 Tax=uncultured Ezakiella sp. TaxID=1637529 RepID=UPI0025EA7681|nr:Ig-like domain-containing protein [uncultured Ezakiella sp.]